MLAQVCEARLDFVSPARAKREYLAEQGLEVFEAEANETIFHNRAWIPQDSISTGSKLTASEHSS